MTLSLLEYLDRVGERRAARMHRPRDIRQFIGSVEPCPSVSAAYVSDGGSRYAEAPPSFAQRYLIAERADCPDLGFIQNGVPVPRSSVGRAVLDAIHLVFKAGGPAKVARVHAAFVALAATVSDLMERRWGGAVNRFAGNAGRQAHFSLVPHHATPLLLSERPIEAIFAVKRNDHAAKELRSLTSRSDVEVVRERIAVLAPPGEVHVAPAPNARRLAAILNRTYSVGSHRSLTSRFRGQGRATLARRFRPAFSARNTPFSQGIAA